MPKPSQNEHNLTPSEAWQATLGELELQLAKPTFDVWLRRTHVVAYEDGSFTIGVPTAFARDWLENRLRRVIKRTLARVMGRQVDIHFIVDSKKHSDSDSVQLLDRYPPKVSPKSAETLIARYTFETFIVGSNNRLAYESCQAVSDRPASAYNPLFLYGGVGLGKTHLLHSIGNRVVQKGLQALYVTSEQFTNGLINSIRTGATEEFRERYRRTDVLLIDDIHFIAGKERTQEEFFHTFNALLAADKQIVLSSDRSPRAISTLEDRLRSRFAGGLIADIQPPDYETRLAILRAKAERAGAVVSAAVLELIAQQVQDNIRELEGALIRVIAYAQILQVPIDVETAAKALQDLLTPRNRVSPETVVSAVAAYFGMSTEDITGTSRKKELALARQIAMYLLCENTTLSLTLIGKVLGNRDHSTVLHGRDKIRKLMDSDTSIRRMVMSLREKIYQLDGSAQ